MQWLRLRHPIRLAHFYYRCADTRHKCLSDPSYYQSLSELHTRQLCLVGRLIVYLLTRFLTLIRK